MIDFLVSRLLSALLVIAGVVCLVFLLIHLIPGDPVDVMLGESALPADREALRVALGLDQPLAAQLSHYLTGLLHLDLGNSLHLKRPVAEILAERIPATLQLAVAALGCALLIALPLGMLAAVRRGSGWDWGAVSFSTLGISIPNFWLGPMLILLFSLHLGWTPVSGRESPASLLLPAITLGTGFAAILARMIRSSLLEVLGEDYVRTARAKGLSPVRVVGLHALRNALIPVVTTIGLQVGLLMAGAILTETIFSWPGVGKWLYDSISRRDYAVVQGGLVLIAVFVMTINLLVDILYGYINPRIRHQ
jgi:peptide/nickel transport system permease protein